jgi:streptogramin lyase
MTMWKRPLRVPVIVMLGLALTLSVDQAAAKKKKQQEKAGEDPYADYVWPPPPDTPRIKLDAVITGRADVEGGSKWKRRLLGTSELTPYDKFKKPFGVEFDNQGRILVTDWGNAALIRIDRAERKMDVFGTRGGLVLKAPMGVDVGPDDRIYVADAKLAKVVAFDTEGKVVTAFGREGEIVNPTDALVSGDGKTLYVADSKAHKILLFDIATGELRGSFGKRGVEDGEFNFPTSLAWGPEGTVFVLDQLNSRVQEFDPDGEFRDRFGELGKGFGSFLRPKDITVDEVGFIYVTDNAFNNLQLFDIDYALLTFVGSGGRHPGQFMGASGVDVRGDEFAVVDQMGARLQVFRFIAPKGE